MATDQHNNTSDEKRNRLVDAVRNIKIAAAERSDVVVEMKEADRARIEILAQELEPVFSGVPLDDERFDFSISSGMQPRLWIDATAQVIMGKDRRQYRFIRDTRMGRMVLSESTDPKPVAEAVTKYIAERLYERELAFAADDYSYRVGIAQRASEISPDDDAGNVVDTAGAEPSNSSSDNVDATSSVAKSSDNMPSDEAPIALKDRESKTAMSSFGWFLIGLFIGAGALLLAYRHVILPTFN